MCYSSQLKKAYHAYLKLTGAEMDIDQFREIYGLRLADPSIRIARMVDLWFEHPASSGELAIRNLILQYRAAALARLEADLARQRERLARAEAQLAVKATKKAAEDRRIATQKIAFFEGRRPLLRQWTATALDDRIFPFHYAPIVMNVEGRLVIRLARYHCRQAGKPPSIDNEKDGLYNARRDNLEKFWRNEFGHSHAVMLAESFFENVQREGRNQVLHFMPQPPGVMFIACVYSQWEDPAGGPPLLSFAAVTDEPPAEIAAAGHDRCPINLKPENLSAWLSPQSRSAAQLQALLDDRQRPYYGHEVLAA